MGHGGARTIGTYRALGHRFRVTVGGASPVDIPAVLGGLEDPGAEPEATYQLDFPEPGADTGTLSADGEVVASGRTRVLLQMLITRVGQEIAAVCDGGAIHATTLHVDGGTVLLAGPTGRGKSTLSARLLMDGAALVAEDISLLDPESLEVQAYHRPVGLSEDSFRVLATPIPPAAGEPCGCGGKVLATAEMLGARLASPARPTVVALVDRDADTLHRLTPAETLARILELGVAPIPEPARDLDTLIRLLASSHCIALGSADVVLAADWVRQLAANPPPAAAPTLVEQHGDRVDVYAGTEAVVVEGDRSHLLNASAAAVWLLVNEGLDRDGIAAELQADIDDVDAALRELAPLR